MNHLLGEVLRNMYILFYEDIKCNAFIKHCKLSNVEDLNILVTHSLVSFLNNVIICCETFSNGDTPPSFPIKGWKKLLTVLNIYFNNCALC